MSDKIFLDSNILIYCFDCNDSRKQNIAQNIVNSLVDSESGQISTQSLQEFFNATTKKIKMYKRKYHECCRILFSRFSSALQ